MMQIRVRSIPLQDVIFDIAEKLKVKVHDMCEEYSVELPTEVGQGTIKGINFKDGIGLIIYDCKFTKNTELKFTESTTQPAKLLYCTKGSIDHSFEEKEEVHHVIEKHQSAIVASSSVHGHVLRFKGGQRVKMSSVEIMRSKFRTKFACDLARMNDELKGMLMDENADRLFYHNGDYSLDIADILKRIQKFKHEGLVRKFFLEAKAYDILTQQIIMYENDANNETKDTYLRRSEIKAIDKAISYIEKQLDQNITLDELAREVGIGHGKLQNGFKALKGMTVKSYIQELRLTSAKELLVSTDMNVSEIVYSIGLQNRSYFARMFKARFGMGPKNFKNKYRRHVAKG